MRNSTARKSPAQKVPKRDICGPAYRRLEKMAMRPADSLFIAAVIFSAAFTAWLVTSLVR
jgi:hypothetical protein